MKREPTQPDLLLWQEVRARAIDEQFGSDRRAVGERVAELLRWVFVLVLAAVNNVGALGAGGGRDAVNLLLLVWAAVNLLVSVALWRRYRPGRRFSTATLLMDLGVGAGLVYLGDPGNAYLRGYLLVLVISAIRLGWPASIATATLISGMYFLLGRLGTVELAAGNVFVLVVVALASARITTELERERRMAVSRAAQADALREMSVNMASSLDIKDVFRVILEHAIRITVAEHGSLLLVFDQQVVRAAGDDDERAEAVAPDVAARGEAAFLDNRATLVVPIASGDGVTAILALRAGGSSFSNEDLFMVNALAGSSAVPLANALHYQRSTEQATTDGLTGMLNHREFRRRLEAEFARRQHRSSPLSLMLIDIDDFKSVNDTMGHQHGDEIITAAAGIVRQTARAHDLVARYGGDEFAVILTDAGVEGAGSLATRLSDAVHAAAIDATLDRRLTLSIGVATYPADAVYVEELVLAADHALYMSKREGRDRWSSCGALVGRMVGEPRLLVDLLAQAGPQVMVAAGHALDARSPGERAHSGRVAALAEAVGEKVGYPPPYLERLRAVAFLHEVGRLVDPEPGRERDPGLGADLLRDSFQPEVPTAIRHRHERWDGSGRPDRLTGVAIPLEARILALADAFERLTAGRDGQALPISEALVRVESDTGAFDPALMVALRELFEEGALALWAPPALAAPRD